MKARRVPAVLGALACGGAALLAGAAAPAPADAAAPARGRELYSRCIACHAIEGHRTGPQHCGLFGRRAGSAAGFEGYSPALRGSGIVWKAQTLDRFLAAPTKAVPGTSMGYAGIKEPRERAQLIAWLRQATQPGRTCRLDR